MYIVVGHEKGGVGKSMLAVNIAARIQQDGASVVIVDTDSTGTTTGWGKLRAARKIEPAIDVVQAPDHPEPVLIGLASQYDAVIIDVGARDYGKIGKLARIVDFWLAPVQVTKGNMDSTLRLYEAMQQLNHQHKSGRVPFYALLNRTPVNWNSSEESDARRYMTKASPGLRILDHTLRDRRGWREVDNSGNSIMELGRRDNAKAIDEFEQVYQEMRSIMAADQQALAA